MVMKTRLSTPQRMIRRWSGITMAQRSATKTHHTTNKSHHAPQPALAASSSNTDRLHEYYNYTSGRWLFNESLRLNERALPFSIPHLEEAAAKAVNKTVEDVAAFRKLAEGGFNRTFAITMKDGEEVIARLPYPIAFPRRLTVASEVATLRLVKLHGLPVPKVLDYSTSLDNPVGTEYILMEKAQGEELGDRWFTLPDLDRAKIIGRLSVIEQKLFSIAFPASGSIFCSNDLDPSMASEVIPGTEFSIGPSVEQRWWHERRSELQISRGPFRTAEQFARAGAEKELAWLKAYGQPVYPAREYREFTKYQKVDPADHVASLENFLQIASHFVPADDDHRSLLKPTLRHPDINPRNIFVDKDLQITSLIDWQHASVVPLFLQSGIPDCFANFGDPESAQLKKPELPHNLSKLSEMEREYAIETFRRRHLHFYYFGAAAKFNREHYDVLRLQSTPLKQKLCFNASAPWQGNTIPLKTALVEAYLKWDILTMESKHAPQVPPISFLEADATECLRINSAQNHIDEKLAMLRERIGISTDGWVPLESYESAVAENAAIKEELLLGANDDERREVLNHWPFDDHEEDGLE